MKKRKKEKKKLNKFEKEFISWGNQKKVFWSITFATIFLSIIGIPIMIKNENFFICFLVIWILEIIYMWMYAERKKKI